MSKYQIIENGILTTTTTPGINLYRASKEIIEDYARDIDINTQAISLGELLKTRIATIDIQKKEEIIDFLTNQILFNELYCFFLNFSIDFSISSRELYLATNKSEQIFYIKTIYIELYRYLERHNKDLGILRNLHSASEEYKEYNKSLASFRTNYYDSIRYIRHSFFAHFDKNTRYLDYYEFVNKLDAEKVARMCIDFLSSQQKLITIFKQLSRNMLDETLIYSDIIKEKTDMEVKEQIEKIKKILFEKQILKTSTDK